ncbi:hypothetical protein Q5752_003505 [Cryptotrichosporon argae]
MTLLVPQTATHHTALPPLFPGAPTFHIHLTVLASTLLIWVGASPGLDPASFDAGAGAGPSERRLAADWGVGMPAYGNLPPTATAVFRAPADLATPMALRLTKRFPATQVHVSLALPAAITRAGPDADLHAGRALLGMERRLVEWVAGVLADGDGA